MFAEGALRIEIHRGSQLTVVDVQYDRALIGSGAHCDVRLGPDEAAVEQLMVEVVSDDEVYVRTRTVEPVCLLNGAPFLEGRLAPTSMLEIGGLAICVQRAARHEGHGGGRKNKSSTGPVVQAAGLIGVAIGLYVVLSHESLRGSALTRVVEPPLGAVIEKQACPQSDRDAARSLAEQAQREADSLRERAPFCPGDGMSAIAIYERAAGCYEVAGDGASARAADAAASELHAAVADEIHLSHVRLERFLTEKKFDEAARQAQLLSDLLPNKSEPYALWLSAVKREGEMRATGATGRKK
ncbi:MAG TPA: hypothetical protein VGI70_16135 [Polyangiales bacterium]|jgi:hypothetical protein